MNREELKQYIGVTAFSLGHVEKDYFQHIVLSALSRRWGSYLVFKGGTALQKIGLLSRFSEYLDFTEDKDLSIDIIAENVVRAIGSYNYPVETDDLTDTEMTAGFRVKIRGPLYRNNRGICTIRVEISRREKILIEPEVQEIDPPYKDVLPYVVRMMDRDEIAAEKIRAVMTRDKVRDLYDLYMLIEHGASFHRDMVEKKLKFYRISLEPSDVADRCEELAKRWDKDLSSLMERVPPKEIALARVISEISKIV